MNKIKSLLFFFLLIAVSLQAAEDVKVVQYRHAGPYKVNKPILSDSLNVNGKAFEVKNLLKTAIDFDKNLAGASTWDADTSGLVTLTPPSKGYELHLFSFYLNSDRYTKGTLEVSGPGMFEVYVDNSSVGNTAELTLEPYRKEIVIKYLTAETDTVTPTLKAVYRSKEKAVVTTTLNPEKRYSLLNIIEGEDFRGVSLSPNGKYALVKYTNRLKDGKSDSYSRLLDAATGRILLQGNGFLNDTRWMPKSNVLYFTRTGSKGTELVTLDPTSMQENIWVDNLPKGSFRVDPNETFLLFTIEEEGPKEDKDLIRVLTPADRIEGYRDRSFIWRYDLQTGLFEQLTFGYKSTRINDISFDSRFLLFSTSETVMTETPHGRNSLYKLNLETLEIDTIWEGEKYINSAAFSPDAKQLMVFGSGPAFGNIGLNIKEDQLPNTYDGQLFLYDLSSREAKALTKEFNPNVASAVWNKVDNQIYILAEDEDFQRIYSCNPSNGRMTMLATSEDVVATFAFAEQASALCYLGQSVSNANRLYYYDLKSNRSRLIHDLSAEKLDDIVLGEVSDWDFVSEDGTTIQGRYYLPPQFDPTKKYPMIVYYYGGTSPTNRMLEQRYAMHMYAALGYVVYTLNPSGTTGFGQEFAARHVNAWGKMTADEIIRGTELFCEEHSYVDKKKIGCIGASYGGFMTQYLQTRTDLFAAAVSHAGISTLSSYWGEGYWGWGYCAAANTGTYPWNNPQFFVEQSPLFHADKINTPLLLIHGNADTNVPLGESIQMFAALKILGKEVEFVQVDGENHGIVGYKKRIGWQNSIFAFFAKWLKEEPEWWEALYPKRNL